MSDAIVIGGGVSGLVAATYLARAGKNVTLLEAQDRLGGLCVPMPIGEGVSASPYGQALYALDPQVIADLKLTRHGLKFAVRDLPLVGLHADGKHIVLQRDVHATAANIAVHSADDARSWPQFRRELFDLARALRPLWYGENNSPVSDVQARLRHLSKTGAAAWLDSWFEADLLKTTLCFDATTGGMSPLEPGSALTLVWRAAQEMSGLQGAVATVEGDTLTKALIAAARSAGIDIQMGARVVEVLNDGEKVAGVRLENGSTQSAPQIFSTLSRRELFQSMLSDLAAGIAHSARYASDVVSIGQAQVLLALRDPPNFEGVEVPGAARFIVCENARTPITADLTARSGYLPDELPMEIVLASASDGSLLQNGRHLVSVRLRPVPQNPTEGWRNLGPKLAEHAVRTLEHFAPGSAAQIVAVKIFTPDNQGKHAYQAPSNVEHLLASYETRIKSPLRGLLFCGGDAEPVPAVSGRAARLAAGMLTRGK